MKTLKINVLAKNIVSIQGFYSIWLVEIVSFIKHLGFFKFFNVIFTVYEIDQCVLLSFYLLRIEVRHWSFGYISTSYLRAVKILKVFYAKTNFFNIPRLFHIYGILYSGCIVEIQFCVNHMYYRLFEDKGGIIPSIMAGRWCVSFTF